MNHHMLYGVPLFHLKTVLDRKANMVKTRFQTLFYTPNNSDTPNFSAWSNENLAQFAYESYRKMQEQHDHIEQLQGDLKDSMVEIRRLIWEASK
jgi:hypothetical protein